MKLSWLVPAWLLLAASCTDHVNPTASDGDDDDDGDDTSVAEDAGRPDSSDAAVVVDAAPEPNRDHVVRVATYNVHLFFDTVCDSGECTGDSFETVPTQTQFDARAKEIAAAIEQIDADVIALEEVEDQNCLDALDAALRARGVVYPIAILGETNFAASVDVVILAKGELLDVTKHRDTPLPLPSGGTTTFAREFLEVRAKVRGATVDMFAAHFRSKNNDDPERRLAEAKAAGAILAQAGQDRPTELVVLGGDLNDVPGSDALHALEAAGGLLRLASDRAPADQGTYLYGSQLQAIDHLYGAGAAKKAYVPGSATVVSDGRGLGGSDHRSLRADLSID